MAHPKRCPACAAELPPEQAAPDLCAALEEAVDMLAPLLHTEADSEGAITAAIAEFRSVLARARGEHALREHRRRADLDSRLGDALRASGISAADALAVQELYATAGQPGSHRIVSALRAIEAWLRDGGAL